MFLYEMHQHTAGCSACGITTPADMIKALKDDGFSGTVITNHFIHGNTGINRNLPWEDFVRCYEEDFLEAKAIGDSLDFDVLFGIEEGVGGGKEVLLYGITPEFLYAHPELAKNDREGGGLAMISRLVREAGGLVFQAHPFRVRNYIPCPWEELPAEYLDGVEAYNACNSALENARAEIFATQHGLPMCAGSDSHIAEFIDRFGIECSHRIRTEAELADVLRHNDYTLHTL